MHWLWDCLAYLTGKYEAKEDSDCELAVAEEDDVEKVRVGWVLEEKPAREKISEKLSRQRCPQH